MRFAVCEALLSERLIFVTWKLMNRNWATPCSRRAMRREMFLSCLHTHCHVVKHCSGKMFSFFVSFLCDQTISRRCCFTNACIFQITIVHLKQYLELIDNCLIKTHWKFNNYSVTKANFIKVKRRSSILLNLFKQNQARTIKLQIVRLCLIWELGNQLWLSQFLWNINMKRG